MQGRRLVLFFRWTVFLLAGAYCLRAIVFSDYDGVGGPFRYLTIWALFLSFFCASRMIALMEGRSTRRWDTIVSVTAVLNAMVVILYWRLYFADASSVTRDGQLGDWWIELYTHGLGPALQWIDSLFIHRSYRNLRASLALLVSIVVGYLAWGELIQRPLNDTPIGSVTSGLPYPFLNDLDLAERMTFYGVNLGLAVGMLLVFTVFAVLIRRFFPRPEAP